MDTRRLNGLYMLLKILFLVAIAESVFLHREEATCLLSMDFTAATLYSLVLLTTCIYCIFNVSRQIDLLNLLKIKLLRVRYLVQQTVQQLSRVSLRRSPHWIQLFKEMFYIILYATGLNLLLLDYISIQDESFELYIHSFDILVTILAVTIILAYVRQHEGTLQRLFVTITVLTINTEVALFFARSFWSTMFYSIIIAILASVAQMCEHLSHEPCLENDKYSHIKESLCSANQVSTHSSKHIAEEHKPIESESRDREQVSECTLEEISIEQIINQETKEKSSHNFCKEHEHLRKEGMEYELMVSEHVADVHEEQHQNSDKENFKRKRDLPEMECESLQLEIVESNEILRNKRRALKFNENISERMGCEQRKTCENLGYPFEHSSSRNISLSFSKISSINDNEEQCEDFRKKTDQIIDLMSAPVEIIKEKEFQQDVLMIHRESEFLNENTHSTQKKEETGIVSDLIQFYESSNKEHQSECFVNRNCCLGDKCLCNNSSWCEMYDKTEHESKQQVASSTNDANKTTLQTFQNVSHTDENAAAASAPSDIANEESKLDSQKENTSEGKVVFELTQMAQSQRENEIPSRFNYNSSTENVVNEIDLRFIYSVY